MMTYKKYSSIASWLLIIALATLFSCSGSSKPVGNALKAFIAAPGHLQPAKDTVFKIAWKDQSRKVYVKSANTPFSKGTILLLHGWNLAPNEWCEKTTLCSKLRDAGFNIIIPDMGKSLYAMTAFKNSIPTMASQPLKTWLTDTVMVYMRDSLKILTNETDNFIVGLSTGARGAYGVALTHPDLFAGVVILSGDYDMTLTPDDNLSILFYGNYEDYPERWEGPDNFLKQTKEWHLPVYIGHGIEDAVVPVKQSYELAKKLKQLKAKNVVTHFAKGFGHNYEYWESESDSIIQFIEDISDRKMVSQK